MTYKFRWWLITKIIWPKSTKPISKEASIYGFKLWNWFTPFAESEGYDLSIQRRKL